MILALPLILFLLPVQPPEYLYSLPLREWEQVDDRTLKDSI